MDIKETNLNMDLSRMANMSKVTRIIVHHSGVDVDQSAKTIHDYHRNHNGWPAIGYHFLIRYNGDIEKGRPLNKAGAHTLNNNHDSIGICLTGNFSVTDLLKRPRQYDALVDLVRYLRRMYPGIAVKKHNDYANTQCPGNSFPWQKFLNDISDDKRLETLEEENRKLKDIIKTVISQLQRVLD